VKFAAIIDREARRDICLLHKLPLFVYVKKSISRNVLDII
jgi:hypothetical protein